MQVCEVKRVGAGVDAIVGACGSAIVGELSLPVSRISHTFPHTSLPPIKCAAKTLRSLVLVLALLVAGTAVIMNGFCINHQLAAPTNYSSAAGKPTFN